MALPLRGLPLGRRQHGVRARITFTVLRRGARLRLVRRLRTLVDLLARADAWVDATVLYGAVTAASSGAPPFGADADRLRQSAALLRQHLTGTELRFHASQGEQMDGGQVIQFALQAIARAAATT